MILSAHQPAYLPWLGYFDKIVRSDVFVFLDDVQFEKNSFINRNKVKTAQGPRWLTVPVLTKGHMTSTLKQMLIDPAMKWKEKHLKTIGSSYAKAPCFEQRFPELERLYAEDPPLLTELCYGHLRFWLEQLGIRTKVVRQSELGIRSRKSSLVLDCCKKLGASVYYSGKLGRDYLDEVSFREAGIETRFQDYEHPRYPQLHGEFVPNLGIVDLWMNSDDLTVIGRERLGRAEGIEV